MRNLAVPLRILLATLWVGNIWAIGYVAAPTLFATLTDRVLAGTIAARLFELEAMVSLACGFTLLAMLLRRESMPAPARSTCLRLTLLMLACTLVGHYGLQPLMAELREIAGPSGVMASEGRERFGMLHGIAAVLHLVQSLAGVWLVLRIR
jgi:hypothetical protein